MIYEQKTLMENLSALDLYKTKTGPLSEDINDVSEKIKAKTESNNVNKLDFKSKAEHFPLHNYYLPGTWVLDEVNLYGIPCLFCIEGNTRYLKVYSRKFPKTDKEGNTTDVFDAKDFYEVLTSFLTDIRNEKSINPRIRDIDFIIWDSARIHKHAKNSLDMLGIKTWMINVSIEPHGPLRVVDRVIRTIRDLIYRIKDKYAKGFLTDLPQILNNAIVNYYNLSPHATLEKMTNIKGMTPWNVHINEVLEKQIITYCQAWNYNMRLKPHYKINVGDKVMVKDMKNTIGYKRRDKYIQNNKIFTILSIKNNKYEIENNVFVPRSLLVKVKEKRDFVGTLSQSVTL